MKLKEAKVKLYRNIIDSGQVPIENSVTCLVGKNESGKTAFLEALYSLKPAYPNLVRVNVIHDYPRWQKVRDERKENLENVSPVEALFVFEDIDIEILKNVFSFTIPMETELVASKTYGGELHLKLSISEEVILKKFINISSFDNSTKKTISRFSTLQELEDFVGEQLRQKDRRTKTGKDLNKLKTKIRQSKKILNGVLSEEQFNELERLIPSFFYFSEYSSLKGRIDLTDLLQKPEENLMDHEHTALSLLKLVGVEGKEFMEEEFEVRIAELEAAANEITRQIFEYWTQNTDLIVDLMGDSQTVQTPQGQSVVHRYLDIRLNDLRHQMTTNFESRSSGFQWFFSFIVAFSEFENNKNVIILLDEPGLGLHARAQSDLLHFIEERLSLTNQVIHTTHSPFMVNPIHLERARLVEDRTSRENPDIGAQISTDILSVRGDTLFPLQAALGYDIAQNLFIGRNNLIVEGPSDLVFLTIFSEFCAEKDFTFLDPKITIVPVGGADKIPTFVALLGSHLDITVLVDSLVTQNQRLQDMINKGLLDSKRLIGVGQITQISGANIEDLFTPSEYLRFYNEAFNKSLRVSDVTGNDSIIKRIERHLNSEFNHLRPSLSLLRNRDIHINRFSEGTIKRFEELFQLINNTFVKT